MRRLCVSTYLAIFATAAASVMWAGSGHASQVTVNGPTGSGSFGDNVTALPNGNIVVTDVSYNETGVGANTNVGAVYLYAPDGNLISKLTGSENDDRVGHGGITVLGNGNFVVLSQSWNTNKGAATFVDATTGRNGVVGSSNSLVGSQTGDSVGSVVVALSNGHYVVGSSSWSNGTLDDVGAVTWGDGTSGVTGTISASNSLIGSSSPDLVGSRDIKALSSGNYLVASPSWDNGLIRDAGALTFCNGSGVCAGFVSAGNSLIGSNENDVVGVQIVTLLSNGNYVVSTSGWDNGAIIDAGAATFGSGQSGITNVISSSNSLIGTSNNDKVGQRVTPLRNGNYVVQSPLWNNTLRGTTFSGAATFGNGVSGVTGAVSEVNSLHGRRTDEFVGDDVTALSNGNYVVLSAFWGDGTTRELGAATWVHGGTGISGPVTSSNSIVGSSFQDFEDAEVTPLSNGNYVLALENWDRGAVIDAGAARFGSGSGTTTGAITIGNALLGSNQGDQVGGNITALSNGNYVVSNSNWSNGLIGRVGAVTFGNGTSGLSGAVAPANSLIGSVDDDQVGRPTTLALSNGNYVVLSAFWNNGAAADAGAITLGNGASGTISSQVSTGNSLVGASIGDEIGQDQFLALDNGNFVIASSKFRNGSTQNAGAVTFGNGTNTLNGTVSASNSLIGGTLDDFFGRGRISTFSNSNYVIESASWDNAGILNAGAVCLGRSNGSSFGILTIDDCVLGSVQDSGPGQRSDYDVLRNQMVVGQPSSNRVVLHRPGIATNTGNITDSPDPSGDNVPTTFTVTVTAFPRPTSGRVTFSASTGESCIDTSGTAGPGAFTLIFSCEINFLNSGTRDVIAEYTGSNAHSYSRSAAEPHTANTSFLFGNSFE